MFLRLTAWCLTAAYWVFIFVITHLPPSNLPRVHVSDKAAHFVTVALERATAFAKVHRRHVGEMGCDVRLVKRLADCLRGTDYVHAQCVRRQICSNFASALQEVDVIATPSTGLAGTSTTSFTPLPSNRSRRANSSRLRRCERTCSAAPT